MSAKVAGDSSDANTPFVIKNALSHDEFFEKLERAFEISKESQRQLKVNLKREMGTHHVQKPSELDVASNPDGDVSKMSESKALKRKSIPNTKPYRLVVLVTIPHGQQRTKFFTFVDAKSLDKFWKDYVNVAKSNMSGLIKKKKKKKGGKKN